MRSCGSGIIPAASRIHVIRACDGKADRAQIGCYTSVEADGLLIGSSPVPFAPTNRSRDGQTGGEKTYRGQKDQADQQEESGFQVLQRHACQDRDLIALKHVSTFPTACAGPWSLRILFAEPTAAFWTVPCPDLAGRWTDKGESVQDPVSLRKVRPHLHAPHFHVLRRADALGLCVGSFAAEIRPWQAAFLPRLRGRKDRWKNFVTGLSWPKLAYWQRTNLLHEGGGYILLREDSGSGRTMGAGSTIRHADGGNSLAPSGLSSLYWQAPFYVAGQSHLCVSDRADKLDAEAKASHPPYCGQRDI